jgi:hypothetical protein
MTERDETTGQFMAHDAETNAPGIPPILSDPVAYEETPVAEEPASESSIEEEAARLKEQRASTAENEVRSYSGVADLDKNVTLTVEQATKIASDAHHAEAAQHELEEDQAVREEVDRLRGVDPETNTEKPIEAELDSEKLNDPKIKEAINAQISEAEAVKQKYSAAVASADEYQSTAFRADFPELAALPVEQWESVISAMQPDRARQVVGRLQEVVKVKSALHQEQQQRQLQHEAFRKEESEKFEQTVKHIPPQRRAEVEGEIAAAVKERGVNLDRLVSFFRTSEGASAELQGILWDYGEARLQLREIKNAPKAVARPNLPPVQRPGTSSNNGRSQGASSSIAALRKQAAGASPTKQAKIEAQIMRMQREARS